MKVTLVKTMIRSSQTTLSDGDSSSGTTSSSSNMSQTKSDIRPIEKFSADLDKLPAVPRIDAFKRGYQVESLLDMFENNFGERYIYIKFKNLADPELVPIDLAVKNVGHLMPRFYKDYVKAWNKMEAEQQTK